MSHRFLLAIACAIGGLLLSTDSASAQSWRFRFHSGGWPDHSSHRRSHDVHHHHSPDLHRLDRYSDKLSTIVHHLHDDAHDLSQDYHHSASIEYYVSELDHLKQHMHEMLHQASRHRRYSSMLDRHLKHDLQRVERLLHALDDELSHQNLDGARRSDFRVIKHMREVIQSEAYPWLRLMEEELYGDVHHDRWRARH